MRCAPHPVAVAEAAAGLPELHTTAQSASCLVGQVFQEKRVHRALQADMKVRDVALSRCACVVPTTIGKPCAGNRHARFERGSCPFTDDNPCVKKQDLPMKRDAAEILKDALSLPSEARAALAGSLLDSLDTEVDEDAEAAWATEVNRRVAELESGAVKTIPGAEVRRRLAAR
jgi:putative addiction module component (TIGR02574 family)